MSVGPLDAFAASEIARSMSDWLKLLWGEIDAGRRTTLPPVGSLRIEHRRPVALILATGVVKIQIRKDENVNNFVLNVRAGVPDKRGGRYGGRYQTLCTIRSESITRTGRYYWGEWSASAQTSPMAPRAETAAL